MAKRVESPHLRVRLDPPLLERLEKARKASGRTMTGEIVARLEESFQVPRYIKRAAQEAATAAVWEVLEVIEGEYKGKPARIERLHTKPRPLPPEQEAAERAEMDEILKSKKEDPTS